MKDIIFSRETEGRKRETKYNRTSSVPSVPKVTGR